MPCDHGLDYDAIEYVNKRTDMTNKNEMIAEWMGGAFNQDEDNPNRWGFIEQPTPYYLRNAFHSTLKYNTDWNWLMRVVERINEMPDGYTCLSIDHDQVFVHRKDGEMLNFLYEENGGMLPTIYMGVCAAIEWIQNNRP